MHEAAGQAPLCINRGSLSSASLLTSSLTLTNGGDSITVKVLWDPGSESLFFSADLLTFVVNQRNQSFKIETLSPSASKPEVVYGLEAAFQVVVLGGEIVTLRLLQHTRLELRALKLKSKILTCSKEIANISDLEGAEPCANEQRCLMKPPAKWSLILGMDVHHVQPKLVDKFSDKHGFLCFFMHFLCQIL